MSEHCGGCRRLGMVVPNNCPGIAPAPLADRMEGGIWENLSDRAVCEKAQMVAKLVRDTDGWTSDIAWAIRRLIQQAARESKPLEGLGKETEE
jgi:hypothetical protein